MPDSTTPNLNLTLPEVGGSSSTWGTKLNGNFEILDSEVHDRIRTSTIGDNQIVGRLGSSPVAGLTASQVRSIIFLSKVTATIGDGTATTFVIDHFLGTRDVFVQLYSTATPYGVVAADIERTSTNSITLTFSSPPAAGAVRVIMTTG